MNVAAIQAWKEQRNPKILIYYRDVKVNKEDWIKAPSKRVVETEQTVDTAYLDLLTLKERFQASSNHEEIGHLARDVANSSSNEKFRVLHELLKSEKEDQKRACLLQVLAELGDNHSIKSFLDEIHHLARSSTKVAATLSQLVAVTYIRFLQIPNEEIEDVIKNIINVVNNRIELDVEKKKNFIMGAIVTISSISQLDESADFLLQFLKYSELDIVEEVLDSLSEVWQRTERNQKEDILNQYRERMTKQLYSLIEEHCLNISNTKSISPHKRIISRAISLLTKVDPRNVSKELIHKLLIISINENSSYLRTAVLDALLTIPNDKFLEILNFENK